jgi:hypothetical protein
MPRLSAILVDSINILWHNGLIEPAIKIGILAVKIKQGNLI